MAGCRVIRGGACRVRGEAPPQRHLGDSSSTNTLRRGSLLDTTLGPSLRPRSPGQRGVARRASGPHRRGIPRWGAPPAAARRGTTRDRAAASRRPAGRPSWVTLTMPRGPSLTVTVP
eukprot:scaffold42156_cov49-Phaeocystis_antarctica.AAC.1